MEEKRERAGPEEVRKKGQRGCREMEKEKGEVDGEEGGQS